MTAPDDVFTNTEADADAALFERNHGPDYPDDRPTLAELQRDEHEAPEWDGCAYCGRGSCADGTVCGGPPDYCEPPW